MNEYSDHPPALEDADIEDVSSNASFVSDSSASVSIATDSEDDDGDGSEDNALGRPFVVPLKAEDGEEIDPPRGERVRRRSLASQEDDGERDSGPRRRPPARTKSGEGLAGGGDGPRRRPPARTKSGEASKLATDFERHLKVESDDEVDGDGPRNKDEVLKRNAARRQKSSDMLLAMRDATKKAPARSKSSTADLLRRPPPRTKSGSVEDLSRDGDNKRPGPRRRPPPRTKSGDGLQKS